MSRVVISGAGGAGADLDVVTARSGDVLAGKVIVGADGEPVAGAMANNEAYNSTGKTKGNNSTGKYFYINIPGGHYDENAQVRLSWDDVKDWTGLTANKIRKGFTVMDMNGEFEGYVPAAADLYYRGSNPSNMTVVTGNGASIKWDSGQIQIAHGYIDSVHIGASNLIITFPQAYNLEVYSKLTIECNLQFLACETNYCKVYMGFSKGDRSESAATAQTNYNAQARLYTIEVNLGSLKATRYLTAHITGKGGGYVMTTAGYIYRISLS